LKAKKGLLYGLLNAIVMSQTIKFSSKKRSFEMLCRQSLESD
jgi:hypothetical protein